MGHAAKQLKTSVMNMMVVNFMSKLLRLCKYVANEASSLRKFKVFKALRQDRVPDGWTDKVR